MCHQRELPSPSEQLAPGWSRHCQRDWLPRTDPQNRLTATCRIAGTANKNAQDPWELRTNENTTGLSGIHSEYIQKGIPVPSDPGFLNSVSHSLNISPSVYSVTERQPNCSPRCSAKFASCA